MDNFDGFIGFPKDKKEAIAAGAPKKQNVAFLPVIFIPFAFPYIDIKQPRYSRNNVRYQLMVSTMNGAPLPYGSLPRLIIAYLATEAVRQKSRVVHLGSSMTDFLRKLDMKKSGGVNGRTTYLKEQLYSVVGCTIYCQSIVKEEDGEHIKTLGMTVVDTSDSFWWTGAQTGAFRSEITLSEQFYNMAINSPVPINWETMVKLKKSPLAMDVYCWATYRVNNMNTMIKINWGNLAQQFGFELDSLRRFKFYFRKSLKKIKTYYPELRYDDADSECFVLYPSRPSINKK